MLKLLSSITIFFIITFSLFGYEGIYEGTYTSYTNVGYETGYYVAYIDAAKILTFSLWMIIIMKDKRLEESLIQK